VIVRLLLFAAAREAARRGRDEFELTSGAPLERLLADAVERYGDPFALVLGTARVWVNGDEPEAGRASVLHENDEIAVLPPVSGGAAAGSAPAAGIQRERSDGALLAFHRSCASTFDSRSYGACSSGPSPSPC
jgi:molybdopterin converting factor small subunit